RRLQGGRVSHHSAALSAARAARLRRHFLPHVILGFQHDADAGGRRHAVDRDDVRTHARRSDSRAERRQPVSHDCLGDSRPHAAAAAAPIISTNCTRRSVVADSNSALIVVNSFSSRALTTLIRQARSRPRRFASYKALSTRLMALSSEISVAVPAMGKLAYPMEIVQRINWPFHGTGSLRTACSSRSAVRSACAGVMGPSTARNSSPPQRTRLSFPRSAAASRWLIAAS